MADATISRPFLATSRSAFIWSSSPSFSEIPVSARRHSSAEKMKLGLPSSTSYFSPSMVISAVGFLRSV